VLLWQERLLGRLLLMANASPGLDAGFGFDSEAGRCSLNEANQRNPGFELEVKESLLPCRNPDSGCSSEVSPSFDNRSVAVQCSNSQAHPPLHPAVEDEKDNAGNCGGAPGTQGFPRGNGAKGIKGQRPWRMQTNPTDPAST